MTAEANGFATAGQYAREYSDAGLSVIPIRDDGSKASTVKWAKYQKRRPDDDELRRWFLEDNLGVAIVYGEASGNAELLDLDDAGIVVEYCNAVEALAPGLLDRLPQIETPRPALHLAYRCETIEGNQKLAQNEHGKALIETRGLGGYALAPGCPPECHPTGRTYRHVGGPPLTEIPTITPEERETLHNVARSFDRYGVDESEAEQPRQHQQRSGLSPGDDYGARVQWADILEPHGWQRVHASGDKTYWRRPGKTLGWSATTGLKSKQGNKLLCVFSTNATPFPGPTSGSCSTHTKFDAYARLHHSGDYSAAARQLSIEGYGDFPEGERPKAGKEKRPRTIEAYKPFPVDSLPPIVAKYVQSYAEAIGCDAAFVGLPMLCCLARAIGNTRVIRLKPTWTEPSILWGAIVGKSGTHKSPALAAGTAILQKRQSDEFSRLEESLREYEADLADYEKAMGRWKRSKDEGLPPPEPEEPLCKRYIVSDTTMEALTILLSKQSDGVLVVRDELAGWLGGIAEYKGGKGSDLGHWLASWSGESITRDRVTGNAKMLHVPRASIGLVGGIQPGILRTAIGREHMQDGLCQRLLLVMPDGKPVRWSEATVSEEVNQAMERLFDKLLEMEPDFDEADRPVPCSLRLDPHAKDAWVSYYNRHREEGDSLDDDLRAAWSKLEAYTARFALIFQLCKWASGDAAAGHVINEEAMLAAINLSDWFGGEAKRVYAMMCEDRESQEQRELLEWIRKRGGACTTRELARGPRKWRADGEAERALETLAKAGIGVWEVAATATNKKRVFRLVSATSGDTFS